jgi:PiT family inorganic phosphate transporter
VAGDVAIAWIITIPASAIVAAIFYWLISGMWIHVLIAAGLIAFLAYFARAWQVQS